jgi:hypothetical protein
MQGEPPHFITSKALTHSYLSLKTRIRDCEGRLWFVRTFLGEGTKRLLPAFEQQASAFVTAVEAHRTGFTDVQMEENSRGPHWFSICGHDRNCKSVWSAALPDI